MVESINKRGLAPLLFLVLLTINNLYAKDHILERQVLSNPGFNFIDVHSINLFIDDDNNTFVLVEVWRTDSTKDFLYINNNWIRVDKYGILLNGFLKDGHFYLAFRKDQDVVIYNIREDIKFVSRIKSRIKIGGIRRNIGSYQDRVIPLSNQNGSYLFLGRYVKLPANLIESFRTIISGGHGIYYDKPFLAEIQDEKMLKSRKIRYGGKIDESFIINEAIKGKDSIHFLGFRGAEEPETSGPPAFARNKPVILHYVDYNFKKKKTTRKHSIYKDTPGFNKDIDTYSSYGPLSMDNLDDDIFIVFAWVESQRWSERAIKREGVNIKNIKSDIYYCQSSNGSFGDIEKIANGFLPLVRVDSLGNVHVLWLSHVDWLSRNGGLVHKVKKTSGWSEEKIILNNIDIYSFIFTRYFSAEFDKDNNLHVVYPSGGNLVHAVVKVN